MNWEILILNNRDYVIPREVEESLLIVCYETIMAEVPIYEFYFGKPTPKYVTKNDFLHYASFPSK
jgi:hypothetical protein